ncbi:MAG: aminotransferase class I/II-fold pyridoxal phosphate-dependent enzyme [Clostridia bacterium]|nr:aminotransferase class I/II-fold pyridoxal phosphate-dependent enzyme [Clostridia bacterium]
MIDYGKILSKTALDLKPSGIRRFFDMIANMDDVVALTVGQPDFVTPWHIREAGIESLEKGMTYYTSNSGMSELRCEIAKYLKRRFDLNFDYKDEVVVTVGGSEAIDLAIRAIVEYGRGDEVIIPTPSFVCYAPLVTLAGGVPVIIETKAENDFKLTADELKKAITPKTKMLVLPYPNNPTGAVMTKSELEEIAKVLKNTNIAILSDEIYAEMSYGQRHTSIATLPEMAERTILVSGFSKAYAMTGWRIGYVCAPREITAQILKIHQYAIMCAPITAQIAATEAVKNGDEDIEMMVAEYDRRRSYIYEGLKTIGLDCFEPKGAFYIFPSVSGFGLSCEEFCERLLYEEKCAIVPGTAFGDSGEGYARISYAYSVKHIGEALNRMEAFVKKLKK